MDTAPKEEEALCWLYCPDLGGWHSAVKHEGRWLDALALSVDLGPYSTFWDPALGDPDDEGMADDAA
jgi:hypothetical protein